MRLLQRRSEIEDEIIKKRLAEIELKKQQEKKLAAEREAAENRALQKAGFNFNSKDLANRDLFLSFLKGDFENIPFHREDLIFSGMIRTYRDEFAKICGYALPSNKVQIYVKECVRESYTVDRWGIESNRHCVKWVDQPTGLYATRELNEAVKLVTAGDSFKSFGTLLDGVLSGSFFNIGINDSMSLVIKSDIDKLLSTNDCRGASLRRIEENLIRFAIGATPIKLTLSTN
jgi:hypothetical protein